MYKKPETKLISPECNFNMHSERFNVGNRVLIMDYKNKHLLFLNPNTGNYSLLHIRVFMYFMKNLDKICKKYGYYSLRCCDCKNPHGVTCPTCRKSASILIFSNQTYGFSRKERGLMFHATMKSNGSYNTKKITFPDSRNSFKFTGKDMWALERVYAVLKSKFRKR